MSSRAKRVNGDVDIRRFEWEVGSAAEALKNVALSEDFFDDHFPRHPVMPGVLILEGMAQLAGLLLEAGLKQRHGRNAKAVLTILERTKFRALVKPGDMISIDIPGRKVDLLVDPSELARRRAEWREPEPKITSGVLARYSGLPHRVEWVGSRQGVDFYDDSKATNVDATLKAQRWDAVRMVKTGEAFFGSLGLDPLPKTFWERSMLVKPPGRDVVCHASAWDVDNEDDLRIKMCIEITGEDFNTIHHELGHNFYQRAYNKQPFLFRDSANDGFHEAIGDTIALSVTPEYLVKIGLLDKAPDASHDIGLLLSRALEKVAFIPFGLVIDQWRWKVFSGEVAPDRYNSAWWDLRLKYQGIAPPSPRGEQFFDPGAKYHVPDNTPYMRYFLANVLEFQFHRALSKAAGCTTPLHRCSIYESKAAGAKLNATLSLGMSKPWPDALEAMTAFFERTLKP